MSTLRPRETLTLSMVTREATWGKRGRVKETPRRLMAVAIDGVELETIEVPLGTAPKHILTILRWNIEQLNAIAVLGE